MVLRPHRLPLLGVVRLLWFPMARPLGEVVAVLHDPVPGQPPGVALGPLRVRLRCVDVPVLEALLVGPAAALATNDLPLLAPVFMVPLVAVAPP